MSFVCNFEWSCGFFFINYSSMVYIRLMDGTYATIKEIDKGFVSKQFRSWEGKVKLYSDNVT